MDKEMEQGNGMKLGSWNVRTLNTPGALQYVLDTVRARTLLLLLLLLLLLCHILYYVGGSGTCQQQLFSHHCPLCHCATVQNGIRPSRRLTLYVVLFFFLQLPSSQHDRRSRK